MFLNLIVLPNLSYNFRICYQRWMDARRIYWQFLFRIIWREFYFFTYAALLMKCFMGWIKTMFVLWIYIKLQTFLRISFFSIRITWTRGGIYWEIFLRIICREIYLFTQAAILFKCYMNSLIICCLIFF